MAFSAATCSEKLHATIEELNELHVDFRNRRANRIHAASGLLGRTSWGREDKVLGKLFEAHEIAIETKPTDLTNAGRLNHRDASEWLTLMDVGNMDFHGRKLGELNRIENGVAVVRVGTRVDDHASGVSHGFM